jgi:hypothetical protein
MATRMKRTKSIRSRSKKSRRSRMSKKSNNKTRLRLYKGGMSGRAPASYVGAIQGRFINSNGQQLFRNPVGGIA